jgi:hypothetical protein
MVNKIVCGSSPSLSPFALAEVNRPPGHTVPADKIVEATSAGGAAITYRASATDDFDSSVTVNCSPLSGSTFPIGTTRVQCTAKDASQNTASCTFTVTVRGARDTKIGVLNQLVALRASVTDRQDRNRLDNAIKDLTDAVNASLWIDSAHPKPKGGQNVFNEEIEVVNTLRQLIKDKQSRIEYAVLQVIRERLGHASITLTLDVYSHVLPTMRQGGCGEAGANTL